jgi:hypothetical protein
MIWDDDISFSNTKDPRLAKDPDFDTYKYKILPSFSIQRSHHNHNALSFAIFTSESNQERTVVVVKAIIIMSLEEAERAIPAVVRMISGCEDKQTSADGT